MADGHVSTFTSTWLYNHCYSHITSSTQETTTPPIVHVVHDTVPSVDYAAFTTTSMGLWETMDAIVQTGFCKIVNVPSEQKAVEDIAVRMAPISHGSVTDFLKKFKILNRL